MIEQQQTSQKAPILRTKFAKAPKWKPKAHHQCPHQPDPSAYSAKLCELAHILPDTKYNN
ncbi:hypothetical protein D0C16_07925 [Cellvibrio sp. KY-GH-1]|nr:hypothetical protein D0C16_07925 [Cellvibrio sp. KY-GH-1]